MSTFWTNAVSHWKSTVSGLLTATLATSAALMTYPPIAAHIKLMSILGGVQLVGKVWIALISQDPDKVMAIVPGSSVPQAVPAHAMPDNPADIPVTKPVVPEVKP
jgi:hypothetical protein